MTDLGPFFLWPELQKYPLLVVELEILLLAVCLLIRHRPFASAVARRITSLGGFLDRHPRRTMLCVAGIALAAHTAALPFLSWPVPGVHDEFSYLLAADTFSSGRLSNPPHPLWQHFESFHIDQQPRYVSMYPPAQGLVLALGTLLGSPVFGVWLSTAAAASALCWMLQGWLPSRYAFVGAMLFVSRIGIFSYWVNTFWGGSLAAAGGCLVWGSVARLRHRPHVSASLLLGAGVALLANTRPYEGAFVSLAALAALLPPIWNAIRGSAYRHAARIILPAAGLLALTAAAMLWYNYEAFGDPLTFPYQQNRRTYAVSPTFFWQEVPLTRPPYHHRAMEQFFTQIEPLSFEAARSASGLFYLTRLKLSTFWLFFLGPALTVPFLAGLFTVRRARIAWPLAGLAAAIFAVLLLGWPTNPHYLAPAAGCLYLLLVQGVRVLWESPRAAALPRPAIAVAVLVAASAVLPLRVSAPWLGVAVNNITPIPWHASELFPLHLRDRVQRDLAARGGEHLVLVRYSAGHSPFSEFVYNAADIDASPVVWARELPTVEQNQPILRYYRHRTVWLLSPDESGSLEPYPHKLPAH